MRDKYAQMLRDRANLRNNGIKAVVIIVWISLTMPVWLPVFLGNLVWNAVIAGWQAGDEFLEFLTTMED